MTGWKPGRRDLLGLAASVGAAPAIVHAQPASVSEIPLWPREAPGGDAVRVREAVVPRNPLGDAADTAFVHVTRPRLLMRRPAVPNGAAVLVIPGGGFRRVAVRPTGGPTAEWLTSLGYTAFMMTYRLPGDGWEAGPDTPLQDAQRAIRLIRARAPELGLDPNRVAVLGFSAGGYIAAQLSTRFEQDAYRPVDAADTYSTRPSASGLFFPVITLTRPHAHSGSLRELLGASARDDTRNAYSAERHVSPDTPPTFIAAAADDAVVPVENSLLMWTALRERKIPSELHIFETGGHSLGGMDADDPAAVWPGLLATFLVRHGIAAAPPVAAAA